jgi:hypothetical protein
MNSRVKAVLGVDLYWLRRRTVRHAAGLVVCQAALVVGYYFYDRQALHSQWSSLSHDWIVPLTSPLWICLPYAIIADSALGRLQGWWAAMIPILGTAPAVFFLSKSLSALSSDEAAPDAIRPAAWLTLIFAAYWIPLLAVRYYQRGGAAGADAHRQNAVVRPSRGWFCCRICWRPMRWDTGHPWRRLWLACLMRPAVCDTCHKRRLAPFFWRHRQL